VDAVKWVIGEQSAKSLRSGQMADVIFSGSSSRKPMSMAEVSLFMDNKSRCLAVDTDEVQITRRIYKSGESEYRLNNKVCRLKDLKEMFLDTGMGTKAYSIIEQGQVDKLVTASKTERRLIFEEAAGISKYKAHKKEAERKLDRTEQNLLRLADIVTEVQKQLRSVKLQAGKARNYLEHTEKLKELQVNYSLAEYHKIATQSSEKKGQLAEVEENFAGIAAELARSDASVTELRQKIVETDSQISQTDNKLVSVQSRIEQHFQRIEFLKTRINELNERKGDARGRIEKLREQKTSFEKDLEKLQTELAESSDIIARRNAELETLVEQEKEVSQRRNSLQSELEDEKSGIIDIVRRTAQLHNELQSLNTYRSSLSSQKERLATRAEIAKAELENLLTDKAQNNARLADVEKVTSELEESLTAKQQSAEQVQVQLDADSKRLANSKEAKSAISSELNVLSDMERKQEGLSSSVKDILRKIKLSDQSLGCVEGIVADIVSAKVDYAGAVEAALEGLTDAIVVNDTALLVKNADLLNDLDGRTRFICMDMLAPFSNKLDASKFSQVKGRLIEFVQYDSRYSSLVWNLLGKVLVVESIEDACEISFGLEGYTFVTPEGRLLSGGAKINAGPLGKTAGLISRKSRIDQLSKTLSDINAEITEIEDRITQETQKKDHLVKLNKELRTAIYEVNTEKVQINGKLNSIEGDISRLTREQPLIASEIGSLEEQISQSVQKEYDSKQKLTELETVNNERNSRIEELEAQYSEARNQQHSYAEEVTDLKVRAGQAIEQQKALKQTIRNLSDQIGINSSAVSHAEQEIENSTSQSQASERDILNCENTLSEFFSEKETTQQESRRLHEYVDELRSEFEAIENSVRQHRGAAGEMEQQISGLKVEVGQLEVREQSLIERVQDELQMDLKESYSNYEQQSIDWEAVRNEINELRRKIERLGNVNVGAIDELAELEERNEFLTSQVEDLNKSKTQLEQLIAKLNKQSREKFIETFNQIRVEFQQLFRKLFGGGKADVMLDENAEDVLEAGIEVVARPPGKEMRSISLLSGGEKTMTAIALLFSVFKAKPSPFCILDEVDAALDEANNERFNLMVSEFKDSSQFIIITHTKRTMSMADILYGITMQIRGVSKKISVRFDQIDSIEEKQSPQADSNVA
jgi:chromosome segregation protein